jgi:hypothetical protein
MIRFRIRAVECLSECFTRAHCLLQVHAELLTELLSESCRIVHARFRPPSTWFDLKTGEIHRAWVFVAVLGFSQLLYARSAEDMQSRNCPVLRSIHNAIVLECSR